MLVAWVQPVAEQLAPTAQRPCPLASVCEREDKALLLSEALLGTQEENKCVKYSIVGAKNFQNIK